MARNPTNPPSDVQKSAEDDVLIREIDEAVREDAVLNFLRSHGIKLLAGIGVLIAGLGGYLIYDSYSEGLREAQSETLITGLDNLDRNDFEAASEKVAAVIAEDSTPGARTSARFVQAIAALERGDAEAATTLFKAIAADTAAPPALRDLARVREVSVNYDTMKPAAVIAALKDLAVPGNPFFGSAGELVAMAHLDSGNRAEAGRIFAEIAKDEEQPVTLRSRARQMAGLLGVDAIVDVEQLLEDQGVSVENADGAATNTGTAVAG